MEGVVRLAIVGVFAAGLPACAPAVSRGGFDAPDPASKLYAIEAAMRQQDPDAVSQIVEELNNDDPAVRMLAASALEQLTGQTLGYDYADPPHDRREAIRRWQEHLAAAPGQAEFRPREEASSR